MSRGQLGNRYWRWERDFRSLANTGVPSVAGRYPNLICVYGTSHYGAVMDGSFQVCRFHGLTFPAHPKALGQDNQPGEGKEAVVYSCEGLAQRLCYLFGSAHCGPRSVVKANLNQRQCGTSSPSKRRESFVAVSTMVVLLSYLPVCRLLVLLWEKNQRHS